ncbi:hypothetical protein SLNSH_04975 [Alsobacter soli]|uniref:Uncharacterized protein n=1 Tax=Alsobacter soli TaxID=2109933 RepID=A0A2T1HWT8_9HYPH|nr:hypothetical protein [Alsobacter soli]PSC06157.1 hypothetical protein SLNSH_04975 [Alsobacter soli]
MALGTFFLIIVGIVLLAVWSGRRPFKFRHNGAVYYRLKDGTFQDAAKAPVTDPALITVLEAAYKKEKAEQDALPEGPDLDRVSSND